MNIIAYDLGTGGMKAALFNEDGASIAGTFIPCRTFYPQGRRHEQRPCDWWDAVCRSTRMLFEQSGSSPRDIACIALSGHSLVVAPLNGKGELLTEYVPIWSDARATDCVADFFAALPFEDWYMTTGNGDPAECYSILKLMWMKKHQPDVYQHVDRVLGSKDYINYKLTGVKCTDPSYASGFGVFNLRRWGYESRFFEAAGVNQQLFPEMMPSDAVIGHVTKEAARATGLSEGTPVACGAVDNTCMALGARGIGEGRVYTSLGSSSWIAVTSTAPVLDVKTRPFIFAHAEKGYYTSGVSIFSAGSSFRWVRDQLCRDLAPDENAYAQMSRMAGATPVGSHGVLFNPSLAGGSAQERHPDMQGGFFGLSLAATREDMMRASMEGVAMALREVLDILKSKVALEKEMLICGGGSKSDVWRQIFADVFNQDIVKTNIDQDAAAVGAAALAANACGIRRGYRYIDRLHVVECTEHPIKENVEAYEQLRQRFRRIMSYKL
jgi:xylulokinase